MYITMNHIPSSAYQRVAKVVIQGGSATINLTWTNFVNFLYCQTNKYK